MRVSVKRSADDTYLVELGEARVMLEERTLKLLLLEAATAMGRTVVEPEQTSHLARSLSDRILRASDIGIQALLHTANEDDILILLQQAGEGDALRERLFANMSDKSRTMFEEDFQFRFAGDSVDPGEAAAALRRLEVALDDLDRRGLLDDPED